VSSRTSSELSALIFSEPVLSGKSLKGPFLAWNFSSAVGFFFLSASSSLPALSVSSLMNMNRFSSTSSHGSFSSCALSFFLSLDGTDPICIFHLAAITVVASDSVNLPLVSLGGDGDSAKISIFFFSLIRRFSSTFGSS